MAAYLTRRLLQTIVVVLLVSLLSYSFMYLSGDPAAVRRFHASQLYKHLESLKKSTLREQQAGGFETRNLIGSPEEICERIRVYQRVGVTTCSGLLFVANTVSEMQEAIELFGREVIPNFR